MIDTSKRFIAGDTVIIFDELQEFPDIATALKSFRIDGRFDVICSGSLLGINYRKIHSNSVGYKTDYEMFSMDFEEFLWAKGYSEKHIEDILKHMQTGTPFHIRTDLKPLRTVVLKFGQIIKKGRIFLLLFLLHRLNDTLYRLFFQQIGDQLFCFFFCLKSIFFIQIKRFKIPRAFHCPPFSFKTVT